VSEIEPVRVLGQGSTSSTGIKLIVYSVMFLEIFVVVAAYIINLPFYLYIIILYLLMLLGPVHINILKVRPTSSLDNLWYLLNNQ
jgi:hypothetical protein